jgi:hypothetical protein
MKNLAKSLKWEEDPHDNLEFAYVNDFSSMYLVYEGTLSVPYCTARFRTEQSAVWQKTGFKTLEEAKAACQQHYAESLWDNLSPRAKVAVSIGMVTLAQSDLTDKVLAEIDKQNS